MEAAQPSKRELVNVQSLFLTIDGKGDSTKLLSLLALAAGAIAMPQTGNADIIFTDLSASPVTVGNNATTNFLIDTLPGTARLGFVAFPTRVGATTRWVTAGQKAGYVRLKTNASFVIPVNRGLTWNQVVGAESNFGRVASANFPNSFDHKYYIFTFKDSTQVGSPLRYGWLDVSLANPPSGVPDLTIFGYAYDNTGAPIPTGQIPEPAPVALLALGALTLGAKGLRSWRRNRPASGPA